MAFIFGIIDLEQIELFGQLLAQYSIHYSSLSYNYPDSVWRLVVKENLSHHGTACAIADSSYSQEIPPEV